MVKALMPAAHCALGRLCRTKAVVDATSDKNTAPNSRPEASTTGHAAVSAGSTVARPSRALSSASAPPPWARSSRRAQMRADATTARPSRV